MKTRLTVAIASVLVASMGSVAFAQTTPQTNPQQPMSTTSSPYTNQNNNQYDRTTTTTTTRQHQMNSNRSDTQVTQQLKQKLKNDGISSDDNVQVTVQDGTARLSGTVDSQQDVNRVKSIAMQVRGVKHVDTSGLQVQGQQ